MKCSERKVFTTGDIARMCKVAPRTVCKWTNSGRLPCYRIPGSQDRRIPRDDLAKFLKEYGLPLGDLENEGWQKVLVIGADPAFLARLKELLGTENYRVTAAVDAFQAGMEAERLLPDVLILDFALGRAETVAIAANLRGNPHYEHTLIIGLVNEDEVLLTHLLDRGFDEVFQKPLDPALLAECVLGCLEPGKG